MLRDAMAGILPDQVLSTPFCIGISEHFALAWCHSRQAYIEDMVFNNLMEVHEFVDVDRVGYLYNRCLVGGAVKDWIKVRSAIILANWIKRERST
jgi:hypothetical protein